MRTSAFPRSSAATGAVIDRGVLDEGGAMVTGLIPALAELLRGDCHRGRDRRDREAPRRDRSRSRGQGAGGRARRTGPGDREQLAPLEVLCLPEFVSGLPGRRGVHFVRCSSANRTPLADEFTYLRRKGEEEGLRWNPDCPADEQGGIPVPLKLRRERRNFSAFLLDEWRANDWLWGRFDAVTTLVDLLCAPPSWPRGCRPTAAARPSRWGASGSCCAVRAIVPGTTRSRRRCGPRAPGRAPGPSAGRRGGGRRGRDDDGDPFGAHRDARVGVLRQERTEPTTSAAGRWVGPPPSFEDVQAWVALYSVGAETIATKKVGARPVPGVDPAVVDAQRAGVSTKPSTSSPSRPATCSCGTSSRAGSPVTLPGWATKVVGRAGPRLGRWGAKRYLGVGRGVHS